MAQERSQRHVDPAALESQVDQSDQTPHDPTSDQIDGDGDQKFQSDPHDVAEHVDEKLAVVHVHHLVDRLREVGFLHAVGHEQRLVDGERLGEKIPHKSVGFSLHAKIGKIRRIRK